jgi:hypothetical protein
MIKIVNNPNISMQSRALLLLAKNPRMQSRVLSLTKNPRPQYKDRPRTEGAIKIGC